MNKNFNDKNPNHRSRHVYNNIIGNKNHLYKHFNEHFSTLKDPYFDFSDELFDIENLYNISDNPQTGFKNLNDFNDIRL